MRMRTTYQDIQNCRIFKLTADSNLTSYALFSLQNLELVTCTNSLTSAENYLHCTAVFVRRVKLWA